MSNKTDRELLEAAARAAGFSCWRSKHGYLNLTAPDGKTESHCHGWPRFDVCNGAELPQPEFADALAEYGWNPLADDGDALRLAVKLRMLIEPCRTMGGTFVEVHAFPSGRGDCSGVEHLGAGDDPAATRRAIVRAAAALAPATETKG